MSNLTPFDVLAAAPEIRVLCVGDVMLDRYIYGHVSRISPEAPVPIMRTVREAAMPGGAGNVARNLASLGVSVTLIGALGDDAEGRQLADLIGRTGRVTGDLIAMRGRPTTLKMRFVADDQQLLRVDAEDTIPIDTATEAQVISAIQSEIHSAHALILSDYSKGLLTDRIINAALNACRSKGIPVIVDPKTQDFSRYGAATVIKPNAKELSEAVDLPTETDRDVEQALMAALGVSSAKAIVVTRAAKGMSFLERHDGPQHLSGEAKEVYDVSGAGDTSLAALALGIAAGASLAVSVRLAIAASGIAVGKSGTAIVTADELISALKLGLDGGGVSHSTLSDMLTQVNAWRDRGLTVGFTNGCFDILHPGHLRVLEEAKSRCGRLIVGLNSDASVRRLKGKGRPVNDEISRARVLNGLSAVDGVIIFEEDTPADLISALMPDLLVKGGDYTIETIVGAEEVIRGGGQVHIVPIVEGQSTTATIARAKV